MMLMMLIVVTGPLTSQSNKPLYETFTIRFQAGHSLTAKTGYYADWVIREHNVSSPAARQCTHCTNYCYHGYENAAESCASSCQCVANVNTGSVDILLFIFSHIPRFC